jgi:hypothetical protein
MDAERLTAPCGLPCFECVVYLAKDSPALREMLLKKSSVPADRVPCPGCRDVEGKCPIVPGTCPIYSCSKERGLKFCCDCADFPCDHLHPYADRADALPHNTKVFNLCLIRKMGVEKWAREKAKSVKDIYFQGKWKL